MIDATIAIIALVFIGAIVYPFMESLSDSINIYLNLKAEKQSQDIMDLILRCNELEQRIKDLEDNT